MVVGKCEHCFNNSIEHNTGYFSMSLYDRDTFITSSLFETRVDYTSHEYNCPINRTTVYIVLLYRAGFQPRFAYLVKYWDFPNILLFACNCLPPGVLSFIYTEYLVIHWSHADGMADLFVNNIIGENNSKIVWQDYQKECFARNTFGVTYEKYMEDIIDSLLEYNDSGAFSDEPENVVDSSTSVPAYGIKVKESVNRSSCVANVDSAILQNGSDSDINFSDKKLGYLAKQSTEFVFIGPDRQMVEITDIQQCVNIAQQIRSTGKPNYMEARYPLKSGLNLEAWIRLLFDYPDRKLLQYLTFGFPLSLSEPETLGNKVIKNHISALQYPEAVDRYLAKEFEAGAIIGPMSDINNFHIHCSPLLTRPKDTDKRRVILDLSFPHGQLVNNNVNRFAFDNDAFTLKFPGIDNIVDKIINVEDPYLAKIDVARAFRNLRVDPADALKFGIFWKGNYYVDVALVFDWVHGCLGFQRASDAIVFLMKKLGHTIFAYIDDYIIVSPREEADRAFKQLSELLDELGLPMNPDKRVSPTKALTCLGINIDIARNILSIASHKV